MSKRITKQQLVWLIDDTAEHHDTARATIAALPGWTLVGYLDAAEAIAAFAALARKKAQDLPAVVLMDFFLGGTYGNVVTTELRKLQPAGVPMTIVGYSSVASASAAIVAAGGDSIVRKHRDERGMNPTLERFLATYPR